MRTWAHLSHAGQKKKNKTHSLIFCVPFNPMPKYFILWATSSISGLNIDLLSHLHQHVSCVNCTHSCKVASVSFTYPATTTYGQGITFQISWASNYLVTLSLLPIKAKSFT